MNKEKTFLLFSYYQNGCQTQIQARILRNGTFHGKGMINILPNNNLDSAKRSAKKRGLGFHLISLDHKGLGYHHINRNDVVCIPKDIHAAVSHNLLDGSALKLEGVLG